MDTQITNITRPHSSAIDIEIQLAIEGKQLKLEDKGKPRLAGEELDAFEQKVRASIIATRATDLKIQEERDRQYNEYLDRYDAVLDKAKELGVKFFHRREQLIEDTVLAVQVLDRKSMVKTVEGKIVKSPFGGQTFAFIYKLDDENNLSMLYSTAFCRNDEQFDEVIGMEESLKKFIRGDVVDMPLSHDRLGEPKLVQMCNEFRRLTSKK